MLSGADGTRTRGLRRDRPLGDGTIEHFSTHGEASCTVTDACAGTIHGGTIAPRHEVVERLKAALGLALGAGDFGKVQRLGSYLELTLLLPS